MEKINIAELLKDCPSGMELDCTILDNNATMYLKEVLTNDFAYPIVVTVKYNNLEYTKALTKHGSFNNLPYCNCVIFPKGKTTWEEFIPPCKFKDGDIISDGNYIAIFYKIGTSCHCASPNVVYYHCYYSQDFCKFKNKLDYGIGVSTAFKYATEEEKEKLFQAIKDNGYNWNSETKTLEKLIEPKFKIGDKVLWIHDNKIERTIVKIKSTTNQNYLYWILGGICSLGWCCEDELIPVSNKFDITTLKPFKSKVLVRDSNRQKWKINFWGFYNSDNAMGYPYECCGAEFAQCIPYEGNEHLLGTADDCDEFYKIWE